MPSVVIVALFAYLAPCVVAQWGFAQPQVERAAPESVERAAPES